MPKSHHLPVIFLILFSNLTFADIYKWTDATGKTHYGDKPLAQAAEKLSVDTRHSQPADYQQDFLPQKEIIMYGASWCGYCRKARRYFKANDIAFTEYDVEKNKRAKKEYDALRGTGYPLLLIGERRMQGFSVARFKLYYEAE